MRTITIYNLGNLPTAALDDFYELQEDFKTTDNERLPKLQMLIITHRNFIGYELNPDYITMQNNRLSLIVHSPS
jgi:hypothetical protein